MIDAKDTQATKLKVALILDWVLRSTGDDAPTMFKSMLPAIRPMLFTQLDKVEPDKLENSMRKLLECFTACLDPDMTVEQFREWVYA